MNPLFVSGRGPKASPFRTQAEEKLLLHQVINLIDVSNPSQKELLDFAQEFKLSKSAIKDCMDPKHLPKYEHSYNFDVYGIDSVKNLTDLMLEERHMDKHIADLFRNMISEAKNALEDRNSMLDWALPIKPKSPLLTGLPELSLKFSVERLIEIWAICVEIRLKNKSRSTFVN